MSRFADQFAQHELESLLGIIWHQGYLTLPLKRLLKLLGKGNRAAGTWQALVEVYEGLGGVAKDLHIVELPHEVILLADRKLERATSWAGG